MGRRAGDFGGLGSLESLNLSHNQQREKHQTAKDRLREAIKDLTMGELNVWATAIMIDHRWCGDTGTGTYWAVANRLCNEAALTELRTRPAFVVEGANSMNSWN